MRTAEVRFFDHNGHTFGSIGAELDPHLFRQINTRHGVDDTDWEQIRQRVQYMKLQKIRMMIMPEWYEPVNDNDDPFVTDMDAFSWDNPEMRSVYRVLDMAEEYGIQVNLTLWAAHASKGSWLAVPGCVHWASPPNDIDEWSENFCALLRYLILEKGYRCIREITPYNEPAPGYYVKNVEEVNFLDYKKMVLNLEQRLIREGLREYVSLCTGDDGGIFKWILECTADPEFESISDTFNSHFYYFSQDSSLEEIECFCKEKMDQFRQNTKKDFQINEFGPYWNDGGDYTDIPQNNSFERGLLYGKMITVLLGEGCTSMLHWCLLDQYYSDTQKMYRGLWRFKDQNWTFRPAYYAIAAITRNTQPGSQMYKAETDSGTIAATALRFGQNSTYLIVNDSKEDYLVNMNCLEKNGVYDQYLYSRNSLPSEETGIITAWEKVTISKSCAKICMPAKSFAVLSRVQEDG